MNQINNFQKFQQIVQQALRDCQFSPEIEEYLKFRAECIESWLSDELREQKEEYSEQFSKLHIELEKLRQKVEHLLEYEVEKGFCKITSKDIDEKYIQ